MLSAQLSSLLHRSPPGESPADCFLRCQGELGVPFALLLVNQVCPRLESRAQLIRGRAPRTADPCQIALQRRLSICGLVNVYNVSVVHINCYYTYSKKCLCCVCTICKCQMHDSARIEQLMPSTDRCMQHCNADDLYCTLLHGSRRGRSHVAKSAHDDASLRKDAHRDEKIIGYTS